QRGIMCTCSRPRRWFHGRACPLVKRELCGGETRSPVLFLTRAVVWLLLSSSPCPRLPFSPLPPPYPPSHPTLPTPLPYPLLDCQRPRAMGREAGGQGSAQGYIIVDEVATRLQAGPCTAETECVNLAPVERDDAWHP